MNSSTSLSRPTEFLLTRGMKGCYVYFEDEATKNYYASRIRLDEKAPAANRVMRRRFQIVHSLEARFGHLSPTEHNDTHLSVVRVGRFSSKWISSRLHVTPARYPGRRAVLSGGYGI